jgi:hypothetical protein
MGPPDVHLFLSHLAQVGKVSASTQNQALNAIAFLYHQVLGRELGDIGSFPRANRPVHLPVVFSPAEIQKVLRNLTGPEHLMACLLYGSGLRLTECTSMRVKDLDFERRIILVRGGKGDKDRATILPRTSLPALHRQLEKVTEIHHIDLSAHYAGATFPDSLERKYPAAAKELAWQYLFPASRRSFLVPRISFTCLSPAWQPLNVQIFLPFSCPALNEPGGKVCENGPTVSTTDSLTGSAASPVPSRNALPSVSLSVFGRFVSTTRVARMLDSVNVMAASTEAEESRAHIVATPQASVRSV